MLDIFKKRDIPGHAAKIGGYLKEQLDGLAEECDLVKERRGVGLIQGLEFICPVGPIVTEALLKQKLVLISAGSNVIRFVPPLIIEKEDVDEMMKRLRAAIAAVKEED